MELFSIVPRHNQMDVLKKVDFVDFARFKQCSKETVEIAKIFDHRLPLKLNSILFTGNSFRFVGKRKPFRLESFPEDKVNLEVDMFSVFTKMHDRHISVLEEFCRKTKLVANELKMSSYQKTYRNNLSIIDYLVKLLNVKSLVLLYSAPKFLSLTELRNVNKITLNHEGVKETDFLLLETPEITITSRVMSSETINRFFMQWSENHRRIHYFSFKANNSYDSVLEGLDSEILWSSETGAKNRFHPTVTEIYRRRYLSRIISVKREKDNKKLLILLWRETYGSMCMDAGEYDDVEEIEDWIQNIFVQNT